jgi:hypothetical protein
MAKLPPGVEVYRGGHRYVDECPDDLLPAVNTPAVMVPAKADSKKADDAKTS